MANPMHSNPGRDKVEADGLGSLDVMIARGAEKVDLAEARDIGLISEATKSFIEQQLPQHDTLFKEVYERELPGSDRVTAFKKAFSIVYGRFQMEDRESITAETATIKAINKRLKVPMAGTENLAKDRPVLAGMMRRIKIWRASAGTKGRAIEAGRQAGLDLSALTSARDLARDTRQTTEADVVAIPGLDRRTDVRRIHAEMESASNTLITNPYGLGEFPIVQQFRNGELNGAAFDVRIRSINDDIARRDVLPAKLGPQIWKFGEDFQTDTDELKNIVLAMAATPGAMSSPSPASALPFIDNFNNELLSLHGGIGSMRLEDLRIFLDGPLKLVMDQFLTLGTVLPTDNADLLRLSKKIWDGLEKFRTQISKAIAKQERVRENNQSREAERAQLATDKSSWNSNYSQLNKHFRELAFAPGVQVTRDAMTRIVGLETVLTDFRARYDAFEAIDTNVVTLDQLRQMANDYASAMAQVRTLASRYVANARAASANAQTLVDDQNGRINRLGEVAADTTTRLSVEEILERAFGKEGNPGDMIGARRKMEDTKRAAADAQTVYDYCANEENFSTLTGAASSYRQAVADCGLPPGTDFSKAHRKAVLELDTAKTAKSDLGRQPNEPDVVAKIRADVASAEPDLGDVDARQADLDREFNADSAKLDDDIANIVSKRAKLNVPAYKDAATLLRSADADAKYSDMMLDYQQRVGVIDGEIAAQNLKKKDVKKLPRAQQQAASDLIDDEIAKLNASKGPMPTLDDAKKLIPEPDRKLVEDKLRDLSTDYDRTRESLDRDIEAKRQAKRGLRRRTRAEVVTLIKTERLNAELETGKVTAKLANLRAIHRSDAVQANEAIETAQATVDKLKTVFAKAGELQKSLGPFLKNIQAAKSIEIPLGKIFGKALVNKILKTDSMRKAMDSATGDQGSSAFSGAFLNEYAGDILTFLGNDAKISELRVTFDATIEEKESERDAAKKAYEDGKLFSDGSKELSDTEVARRIVRAMVDEEYPGLSDDRKKELVEDILAEDVEIARTEAGYEEIASRGSEELMQTVSNSALKNLLGLRFTFPGASAPIEPLKMFKPEDFKTIQSIDALFGKSGTASKISLKNGFLVLSALERSGTEGVASLQVAHLRKRLRNLLLEDPEFAALRELKAEKEVQKLLDEVMKGRIDAADDVLQRFVDHKAELQEDLDEKLIEKFNATYKKIQSQFGVGEITAEKHGKLLAKLVAEVREAGLEGKVDFSCDTAFAEFMDSKQGRWVRDLSKSLGLYAGRKALAVGSSISSLLGNGIKGTALVVGETAARGVVGLAKAAVKYPYLVAANSFVGIVNLFRRKSNQWNPVSGIFESARGDIAGVMGYAVAKTGETIEGAKGKITTIPKEKWAAAAWERKKFADDRAKPEDLDKQIDEADKGSTVAALELAGDPQAGFAEYKARVEKLVSDLKPKKAGAEGVKVAA